MMEECEVIGECPDDKYPAVMDYFVNDEHQDRIRNYLIEENYAEVHDEVREISIEVENEDVIHIDITENEAK